MSTCEVFKVHFSFWFQSLFWQLTGCALLALGIWTMLEKMDVSLLISPLYAISVYALMSIGGLILFSVILGCRGTVKENRCNLLTVCVENNWAHDQAEWQSPWSILFDLLVILPILWYTDRPNKYAFTTCLNFQVIPPHCCFVAKWKTTLLWVPSHALCQKSYCMSCSSVEKISQDSISDNRQ